MPAIPVPAFPGAVATDANLAVATNRLLTALALPMGVSDVIISLISTTGVVVDSLLSIDDEIVQVTALSPNITVSRGFDGTTPAAHLGSAAVSGFVDAWHHNALAAEVKAIETALGANLSNVATGAQVLAAAYNFTPLTPGGSLVIGANSITLTPVPRGVNGTDANHLLYISNGTGTAEAVPIIGGTAVAGAASGTIIVTCANTHSGAWTIASATAGIQEALQSAGASSCVLLAAGTSNTFGAISLTASYQMLLGQGEYTSIIRANFNSGHIIKVGAAIASPTFDSFGTCRLNGYSVLPSSGDTIQIFNNGTGTYASLRHLYLRHNYTALNFIASTANCSAAFMQDIKIEGAANSALIGFLGTSENFIYIVAQSGNSSFGSTYSVSYTPVNLLNFQFADGVNFTDTLIGGPASNSQILFSAPATSRNGLVRFTGLQIDSWAISPAVVFGGVVGAETIVFNECDFSTSGGNSSPAFRVLTNTSNVQITNCTFINMGGGVFDGANDTGILSRLLFANNLGSGLANTVILMNLQGGESQQFIGNQFNQGGGAVSTVALQITGAANGLVILSNLFYQSNAVFNITATLSNPILIAHNLQAESAPQTVASASSILLAVGYPFFVLTGTTGIGALTGLYEGRQVTLLTNGAGIVFTASTTIGNTITLATNVPLVGTVFGGKLYLK